MVVSILSAVTLAVVYGLQQEETETMPMPKVHIVHEVIRADYELLVETKLAPPKPSLSNRTKKKRAKLNTPDDIETYIMGEEPMDIHTSATVDQPAIPTNDLQEICDQITEKAQNLIPCKTSTIRIELLIHEDGSLIEWQVFPAPQPPCEAVLLSFISNVQKWKPAKLNNQHVAQKVFVHIHFQ